MPRDFNQVRSDLEGVVARLKSDPQSPRMKLKLLKQLRLLIEEADILIAAEKS
jgi:hypothetical protein